MHGDLELFRLASRHSHMWKVTIVLYEVMASFTLAHSILFWSYMRTHDDYSNYEQLQNILLYLDSTLPLLIVIADFSLNAVVFNANHSAIVLLFLVAYDLTNFLITHYQGPVYQEQHGSFQSMWGW
mgnify:CR=1 FL=1